VFDELQDRAHTALAIGRKRRGQASRGSPGLLPMAVASGVL
jgi:hypothetical protein